MIVNVPGVGARAIATWSADVSTARRNNDCNARTSFRMIRPQQASIYVTGLLLLAGMAAVPAASATPAPTSNTQPMQAATAARAVEAGAPLLHNFSPAGYGGEAQNWAIVQDPRGVIYAGNGEDSVLEYDGIRWRRIPIDNNTVVRSLAVGPEGRVYVGAVGELGYLAPDASGRMQYVSLLQRLPSEDRDFGDVWGTFAIPGDGIYFGTFDRLIRIAGDEVRVWRSAVGFHRFLQVRDALYVRELGRGLMKQAGEELKLVPNGERFANEKIYALAPWPVAAPPGGEALLIGTRTQGWFVLDGSSLRPWATQADAAMNESLLYDALWLSNGVLAAGTLRGGVFLLDA